MREKFFFDLKMKNNEERNNRIVITRHNAQTESLLIAREISPKGNYRNRPPSFENREGKKMDDGWYREEHPPHL